MKNCPVCVAASCAPVMAQHTDYTIDVSEEIAPCDLGRLRDACEDKGADKFVVASRSSVSSSQQTENTQSKNK